MHQTTTAYKLLDRGVWTAPYLIRGYPALVAVNRFGVVVAHTVLRPGVDPVHAADALDERLDRLDPPIHLVREPSPAQPRAPQHPMHPARAAAPREIDPRLFSDPRSPLAKRRYLNTLVKNAAAKAPRLRND